MPELSQSQVEAWVTEKATGIFHYAKILDGQVDPKLLAKVRAMLMRCKEKGIAYPVKGRDGWWRPADNTLEEVQWWDSGDIEEDALILPLDLHMYCRIPKPSLIVIAGKYNAGKTAFCLNTVALNEPNWPGQLDFYVSEGAQMIKSKFEKLGITQAPSFRTYHRTENFADVIKPDNLSVIDYLRVNMEKTYEIGNELFRIFNKLNNGIAVVAMQKPPGDRKLAFGGASTAFEPTLYIGMDKDVLGFEKIKVPKLTTVDPYSVKIEFRLKDGVNFYEVHEVVE